MSRRRSGHTLLESERQLTRDFNTCRGTIRKVLKHFEDTGVIRRDNKINHIITPSQQKYRYGFITQLHRDSGAFWSAAYARIWMKLCLMAREESISVELIDFDPDNPNDSPELIASRTKGCSVVINACLGYETEQLVHKSVPYVLSLHRNSPPPKGMVIAIDDYAVGRMGAEMLLQSGCRASAAVGAFISPRDIPFTLRIQGFRDTLEQAGLQCEVFTPNNPTHNRMDDVALLRDYVSRLPNRGFDSLFFLSDEHCDFIVGDLFHRKLVPDKFSIAAFDGAAVARSHRPAINAISHRTTAIAEQLLIRLRQFENQTFTVTTPMVLIEPQVYGGRSLRRVGTKNLPKVDISSVLGESLPRMENAIALAAR